MNSELAILSLAVLPFKEQSDENEGLGEGVAENIIASLSRIPELRVVGRRSSFAIKYHSPAEAGDLLNASMILEGTVQKDQKKVMISVVLYEVSSGLNIWSKQYEDKFTELLQIIDDITFNITERMHLRESVKGLRGMRNIHSSNVDAYQYYLRGRKFYYQFSEHDILMAIRMYRKAIEIDPHYALAFSGLAECYSYLYMYSPTDKRNLLQADQSSKAAIKLDESLADSWTARGVVLSNKKKYEDAAECFEKAVELDPMHFEAPYQYARMSFAQGLPEKALQFYEKAMEIRPDDYQCPLLSAQSYEVLGFPEKAEKMRIRGVEIVEQTLKFNSGDTRALSLAANGLVALGKHDKALDFLERALKLEPEDPMLLYNAGCIYAMCGKEEEALDNLEKSAKTGLTQKEWYVNDDNLDTVRGSIRFRRMLESMK